MHAMDLKVGQSVSVTVINPMHAMRYRYANHMVIPEHLTFSGSVVREKWHGDDRIGLTTGEREFKTRVIKLSDIVSVDGMAIAAQDQLTEHTRVWQVQSSKGGTYTVTESRGRRECTCPGFTYRKDCKHVHDNKLAA